MLLMQRGDSKKYISTNKQTPTVAASPEEKQEQGQLLSLVNLGNQNVAMSPKVETLIKPKVKEEPAKEPTPTGFVPEP